MPSKVKVYVGLVFLFLCVLCSLNLRFGPSAQVAAGGQMPTEVTTTIDDLAKDLAELLAHPGLRNHLRAEIRRSAKREKIVFLDEFLAGAAKVPGLPDQAKGKANGALSKAKAAKGRFSAGSLAQVLVSPEIDVYFPVRNHRDKWTGGDDLLVAVGTLDDNASQIKVYSVRTQEARYISGATPPVEPVIFVSPCEHESHEAQPILQNVDIPEVKSAPTPPGEHSWILTNYFKISTTSEGWGMGDPEIYVWVAQAKLTKSLNKVKKYLPGVNDEGVWKDLAECPTALGFYWDDSYDTITFYKVMEEDTGSIIHSPVSVGFGSFSLSFTLDIHNYDDELGSVNVDRNQVGWCPYGPVGSCCSCYTSSCGTGKAWMRMTLAR